MARYQSIRDHAQKKYQELSDKCHLFWAFSQEQFNEGKAKHPLQPGEKYVAIGAGGYMPKRFLDTWIEGTKVIDRWRKSEIKRAKAEEVILYELNNYEAFYTGDIDDAMEVLADHYTRDEVMAVYKANVNKVSV